MTKPTTRTAKMLLDNGTPVAVQHAVHSEASATGDVDTLVALCRIATLDPDVEAKLAATSHVAVLLAWAQRHGRTTSELVERFTHERRGRLLTHLASAEGLDPALYDIVADRGGASVLACLVANPSVAPTLRRTCAQRLGATLAASSTIRFDYGLLNRDAELAEAAATRTMNLRIIVALAGHLPTGDTADPHTAGNPVAEAAARRRGLVVERLLTTLPHVAGDGSDWVYLKGIITALTTAGIEPSTNDTLAAAVAKVHHQGDIDNSRFDEVMITLRTDAAGAAQAVEAIVNADRPAQVYAAFLAVVTQPAPARVHQRAHAAVLTNPHLYLPSYRRHLRDLHTDTARNALPHLLDQGRSDIIDMFANRFGIRTLATGEMRTRLVTMLCTLDQPPLGLLHRYPQPLLTSEQALSTFGYDVLCARGWRSEVAATVADALGYDRERWEMFIRLAGEWHGSLRSLLDSITALDA